MDRLKKLWQLFFIFFKVGSFTFGGGLAMLPLIQREVVDNQEWVSEDEILDVFAISQSVPGVIAINSSIFIGNKVSGIPGAVAAAVGVIAPAFISIILLLVVLTNLQGNPYVEKVFNGIKAASTALILLSAIKLGKSALRNRLGYILGTVSFLIIVLFNVNAAWAVVIGGSVGYAAHRFTVENRRGM